MRVTLLACLVLASGCAADLSTPGDGEGLGGGKGDGPADHIALADRERFCEEISVCAPNWRTGYDYCVNIADLSANQHLWHEGCRSDRELRAVMACAAGRELCADGVGECLALYDAWMDKAEGDGCAIPPGFNGIGDPYPEFGDGTFFCQSWEGADAGYCTDSCESDADCAGHGEDGKNRFGTRNICLPDGTCAPTCSSTTTCQDVYNDWRWGEIVCGTPEGASASVCMRIDLEDDDD
jgi:hypothetical protein